MEIISGFLDYFRVLPIVTRRSILPYMLIPMVMALLILAILWGSIFGVAELLGAQLVSLVGISGTWAVTAAAFLSGLILAFIALLILRYVLIILCSPILSIISERVELELNAQADMPPFSLKQMGVGVWRGLRFALRNVGREMLWTLLLLLLSLIPGMVFITSILLVVVQAYYIGYGHLDFALERKLSIRDTIRFVKQHKGYALGNGLAFWLLLFIPVLGLLIALPLGAAAATYGLVERPGRFGL